MKIGTFGAVAAIVLTLAATANAQSAASNVASGSDSAAPTAAEAAPSGASPASSAVGSSAAASAPAGSASETPPHGFVGADVPTPPTGKGQVVFFRKSSFQGSAVWFKIREDGRELGKLSNGVYFIQIEDPGLHVYTAATENKDTLKLQVDPGETYFVEGQVTMGMFIGEANLAPSDQDTFEKASHKLKLAAAPTDDKPAVRAGQ